MQEKRQSISSAQHTDEDTNADPLRDALRKSFEESLKAPPSARLEDLMAQLRSKERSQDSDTKD
ncbi:hypothetical protein L53_11625 [Hyphomonas sp. L-53-1-40]|nr:hypothetical protein L53_11625 [Hyphomonas sp. L-53-1-40]